jgi:hypothetical protein
VAGWGRYTGDRKIKVRGGFVPRKHRRPFGPFMLVTVND